MKTILFILGLLHFLLLTLYSTSWADSAICKIEIEDVNKGTTYNLEHKFAFKKGGDAQRKHFETPGNDYTCTLAFFDLNHGTMLSCEYKNDLAQTFFQSDRSVLKDIIVINNLSFRHNKAFIYIKTKCE